MFNSDETSARLAINDKQQIAVLTVLCLATGSLVLPIVFLQEIIGFTSSRPLGGCTNGILSSWMCFLLSMTSCIGYFYASVKFIRSIHNAQPSRFWKNHAEAFCSWFLRFSLIFFLFGIVYFVLYVYLVYFRFY